MSAPPPEPPPSAAVVPSESNAASAAPAAATSLPASDMTAPPATAPPTLVKSVSGAQAAFDSGDASVSKALHEAGAAAGVGAAKESHGGFGSDYVKSIVFGGLDGIITSFAIVASVVGAELSIEVVIFTGFAKLFGDAISMGFGDCISEQAEQTHVRGERSRDEHPKHGQSAHIWKVLLMSSSIARQAS